MATGNDKGGARRRRRSPEEIMQRLVGAAAEEFTRSGYRGATTAAIAERAEVTEAQLFRYFDSKAELFRSAVFEPLNTAFAEFNARELEDQADPADFRAEAARYIADLQEFIGAHGRELLSVLVREAYAGDSGHGVSELEALGDYFRIGAEVMSGRLGDDARVAPELMVRVSFAAVLANVLFRDWLFPRGMASDEAITAAVVDFVVDGIRANEFVNQT